jgi:hypothetical protein
MPTLVRPAVHFIRHLLGMCAAIRIGSAILRRERLSVMGQRSGVATIARQIPFR